MLTLFIGLMLTPDDQSVIRDALIKYMQRQAPDSSRAEAILASPRNIEIDIRSGPFIGRVLSWNSTDPKACALMQRIAPTAVCMK